ncbi:flavoprotein-like protein [Gymnopilus junonius]|uniref:Flavoprotein-like protein n=1 Tax=Gymnopilus junonius TaxID=109634 RepID=A0A9P5TKC1_GYMJU|nr:flavoprotein-like protein [Gymnopilus junonius]
MCFPSKKQKNNFSDNTEKDTKPTSARNGAGTKSESNSAPPSQPSQVPAAPVSSTPAPTLPPLTTTEAPLSMAPKVAIIIYSMYGHVAKLAEAEKVGIEKAGGKAEIYQVAETLSEDILAKMYAPPKAAYPIITPDILATFDAFLLGIPTRYGSMPAQWKSFWDSTGQLWQSGKLAGKYAGFFVSTAGLGGGQEVTVLSSLSTLTHHGILYVPFGYSTAFAQLTGVEEVHGGESSSTHSRRRDYSSSLYAVGSPWGAGTVTNPTGSRQPSALELEVATIQGEAFYKTVSKVSF